MVKFGIGQTASCSKTFTEEDILLYARLSGDYNPIHIDPDYAKNTRFKERIAHGLLTSSILSKLLGMHLPGKGSVYMNQTLRFTAPVFIGDKITATGTVTEFNGDKHILTLLTECRNQNNQLVLIGHATMLVPRGGEN